MSIRDKVSQLHSQYTPLVQSSTHITYPPTENIHPSSIIQANDAYIALISYPCPYPSVTMFDVHGDYQEISL